MITRDVKDIVRWAVNEARSGGRDYIGQADAALKAVLAVRPDLSRAEIMQLVYWAV